MNRARKIYRIIYRSSPCYAQLENDSLILLHGDLEHGFSPADISIPYSEAEIIPPVVPGKIVGMGLNYTDIDDELALPDEPKVFLKSPQALIMSGCPVEKPSYVEILKCEVELAVVMGSYTKCVSPEEALEKVFGYLVANDVTASDLQAKDGVWGRAKNFDTFCPVSDHIVTGIDPSNLRLKSFRNGEKLIDSTTDRMYFDVARTISYISGIMTLKPGDMIITGTPTGYGITVIPGDTVRVEIDGIGMAENPVVEVSRKRITQL